MENNERQISSASRRDQQRQRFEKWKPRLKAVPSSAVTRVTLDLRQVAISGQQLVNKVRRTHVQRRLGLLHPELLRPTTVQDLDEMTDVIWFIKNQSVRAQARTETKRVPDHILNEAQQLRSRQLALAKYYLQKSPKNQAEIAKIQEGGGHIDLATDLEMLAELIFENTHLVERDEVNYRPGDVERSLELVDMMREAMAEDRELDWAKWAIKAFALFRELFNEVRRAAIYVSHDLDEAPTYPPLFVSARKPSRKKKKTTSKGKKAEGKKAEGKKAKDTEGKKVEVKKTDNSEQTKASNSEQPSETSKDAAKAKDASHSDDSKSSAA